MIQQEKKEIICHRGRACIDTVHDIVADLMFTAGDRWAKSVIKYPTPDGKAEYCVTIENANTKK